MNGFGEFLREELKKMRDSKSEKISRIMGIVLLVGVLLIHMSDLKDKIIAYIMLFVFTIILEFILKKLK